MINAMLSLPSVSPSSWEGFTDDLFHAFDCSSDNKLTVPPIGKKEVRRSLAHSQRQ